MRKLFGLFLFQSNSALSEMRCNKTTNTWFDWWHNAIEARLGTIRFQTCLVKEVWITTS